jgi:hypothetical protein
VDKIAQYRGIIADERSGSATVLSDNTDTHNFCFLMYDTGFQCVFIADNKFKNRILLSPTDF